MAADTDAYTPLLTLTTHRLGILASVYLHEQPLQPLVPERRPYWF